MKCGEQERLKELLSTIVEPIINYGYGSELWVRDNLRSAKTQQMLLILKHRKKNKEVIKQKAIKN